MQWKKLYQFNLMKIIITLILSIPVITISLGAKILGFQSWCMLLPGPGSVGIESRLSISCVIITIILTILIIYFIVGIFEILFKKK